MTADAGRSRWAGRLAVAALAAALAAAPATAGTRVYAAGDIADCGGREPATSAAATTARMIPAGTPVLMLGDAAYPHADRATLEACYGPTWGRLLASTFAVAGNHDYVGGSAREFLDYFGERNPHHTYFRAALGDWWVIGLDSNLAGRPLARQAAWLQHELAAVGGDGRCIVALWHHALFSTGLHRGDGARMKPVWAALDAAAMSTSMSPSSRSTPTARRARPASASSSSARAVDTSSICRCRRATAPSRANTACSSSSSIGIATAGRFATRPATCATRARRRAGGRLSR